MSVGIDQPEWWRREIYRRARSRLLGSLIFIAVLVITAAFLFLLTTSLQVVVQPDATGELYGFIPRTHWIAVAFLVVDAFLGFVGVIKGLLIGGTSKAWQLWFPTSSMLSDASRGLVKELNATGKLSDQCARQLLNHINQWPGEKSRVDRLSYIGDQGSSDLASLIRESQQISNTPSQAPRK
jgi:hypothetical protein